MEYSSRYPDLLNAVVARLGILGAEAQLVQAPADDEEPFVLSSHKPKTKQPLSIVLVYPPLDIYLNSIRVAEIVIQIHRAEQQGMSTLLLFSEPTLSAVQNVLRTAGITAHAAVASYQVHETPQAFAKGVRRSYDMSWELPAPPITQHAVEPPALGSAPS